MTATEFRSWLLSGLNESAQHHDGPHAEAIAIAVGLGGIYLALNVVVVGDGLWRVIAHPGMVGDWTDALTTQHGNPLLMVGIALLVFPKLALGLSGFETGVAVMPHIKGDRLARIRAAKQLLTTAAGIMSVFLLTSSLVRGEVMHHRYRVLSLASSSVPSALAALLLWTRDTAHRRRTAGDARTCTSADGALTEDRSGCAPVVVC